MHQEEDIKQAAKVHKALGEPIRLKITIMLAEGQPLCCHDMGTRLGRVPGSTLSHHLKQLTECGLLESSKEGTYIYYSLNREVAKRYFPEIES
ncbi:ArsR/SmtB family transcription factor [Paenibacillus sp. FSL R10-2736]|uniref:ArsR/SmtB family transcription factor n=1 Tax=Paenibacillus sp. FSL R10-2736 TaxID=2954692 RepID=UPI000FA6453F